MKHPDIIIFVHSFTALLKKNFQYDVPKLVFNHSILCYLIGYSYI